MLPVSTRIDSVLVELEVSDIADHSAAVHAGVILMQIGSASNIGGDGFESLVDGGH